jgi:hypothetical protein
MLHFISILVTFVLDVPSLIYKHFTELRGQVVKIPASYSEGPGSNLSSETGYPNYIWQWT